MSLRKTEAIVLRSINHGETSKILTLYSRALGKVTVIAKGARNVKSRFGGNIELMNFISTLVYQKENREIQFLSQADILETFPRLRADLTATAVGLAVCELVNQIQAGQESNPLLFRLLLTTFRCLDSAAPCAMNFFRAFELHVSDLLGFRPTFNGCIACGKPAPEPAVFDLASGGLRCPLCRTGALHTVKLRSDVVQTLHQIQKTHMSRIGKLDLSPHLEQQIDAFLYAYLKFNVEGLRELKSLKFLRKI